MEITYEAEDIMCDQCIISSELEFNDKKPLLVIPISKVWLALNLLSRAVFPSLANAYDTYIRSQNSLVRNVRHQLFPTVVAFLANSISRSLASVQRLPFAVPIKAVKVEAALESAHEDQPESSVECVVLAEPQEISVDVIFIHGLHGGLDKTWKQGTWRQEGHKLSHQTPVRRLSSGDMYFPLRRRSLKRTISEIYSKVPYKMAKKNNGNSIDVEEDYGSDEEVSVEYSSCWPKDWIPMDCPGARVIALNYSTDVLWSLVWMKKRNRTGMVERSQEMIDYLVDLGVGKKPIVWVGHSKGGLFIKQILVNAWQQRQNYDVGNLANNTKSIMFYSVPHKGSALADFTLPLLRRSVELIEIQRNCQFVLNLHEQFLDMLQNLKNKPEIFSFIETSFTLMSFVYLKIVAYESADPNVGLKCDVPLDHREICKPAGRDCFLYLELAKLIKKASEQETESSISYQVE